MGIEVVTEVDGNDRVVVRKTARAEDRDRLVHEAEVLALAQHPGVVEVLDVEMNDDEARLETMFVGTHSLETIGPLSLERTVGIVAALAETIADLHQVGVVHGRIELSHVLIGTGGRPVLCGFAGGGRIGTSPPPGPAAHPGFLDPAASDDSALTPQRDVYGLGALLRSLIGDSGAELEPIPDRRFGLGGLRTPWAGYQRRALQTLIDRATDDAPLRRPPARRLAADLRETMPSADLRSDDADPYDVLRMSVSEEDPAAQRLRGSIAVMVVGVVVLAFGINGLRSDASTSAAGPTQTAMVSTTSTSRHVATTDPVIDSNCSTEGPTGDDFDGDGCGDAVQVGNDGVVSVGHRRFAVGQEADRVAVGDWDCNGVATAAVLRPSTGAIFVFDHWDSTGPITAQRLTSIAGAVDIYARVGARGCSTLIAVLDDGTEQEIM